MSHPPTSKNISIIPVSEVTIDAYRRLITLLLPIRYPDKFYKESVANSTPSSLALCAIWHDSPQNKKRKIKSPDDNTSTTAVGSKVVAGIQCRLEPIPTTPTDASSVPPVYSLYVQTIASLSPYRSLGIGTALLDAVITAAIRYHSRSDAKVVEIYAHVWEVNREVLDWYVKRGFQVEQGIVQGYYRKLKPSGARVVRRRLGVADWLRVKEGHDGVPSVVNGDRGLTGTPHTKDKSVND